MEYFELLKKYNLLLKENEKLLKENIDLKNKLNLLNFGGSVENIMRLDEDELKLIMGRRHSGSSYPEEAKDCKEYAFYESNGFEEAGNSRLLYKIC